MITAQEPKTSVQFSAGRAPASWLITGSNLDPRFGGISSVVGKLCSAVAEGGAVQTAVAQFDAASCQKPTDIAGTITRFPLANMPWFSSTRHWRCLAEAVDQADGVHVHGIWQKHCTLSAFMAQRFRKPYLLSAHGMLDGWALRDKRWKKAAFLALVEGRNIRGAQCLHALTTAEAADYKQIAPKVPVAVIPNGVDVPQATSERFLDLFPHLADRRLVLFLGRLHYKKGVDILVQSWKQIHARWPDAHLVLAGPDSGSTETTLKQQVEDLGLTKHVTFTGMLDSSMKWSALASAHCFILPSHSEGLSVSVLEAMGSGLPVIITPNCHLPEVATSGAGWIVEPIVSQIGDALDSALQISSSERTAMGLRGLSLVKRRYSWLHVGAQMAAVYGWVSGGKRPNGVEIL